MAMLNGILFVTVGVVVINDAHAVLLIWTD